VQVLRPVSEGVGLQLPPLEPRLKWAPGGHAADRPAVPLLLHAEGRRYCKAPQGIAVADVESNKQTSAFLLASEGLHRSPAGEK
jgi:hypothetical protein